MELTGRPGTVTNVTAEQVREFTSSHAEASYQLVDVRQPEEYGQGHIPGAQLIPLGELDLREGEVARLTNRKAVFYCRSGARSARAATWAAQVYGLPKVYNLLGGFMGWDGASVPDFPRLKALDLRGDVESLLRQAIDLEKGTYRLYGLLAQAYADGPVGTAIFQLAQAEIAHARTVHRLLGEISQAEVPGFEQLFAQTPGALIESGESFEEVVDRAQALERQGSAAILELALDIELNAYDLYKNVASQASNDRTRALLLDLSQQEKRHADSVLKGLGKLAALG